MKLWDLFDGEPYLGQKHRDNPYIAVVNPPRSRSKKMAARRRKRGMPAGLKRYWATHKRRSNPPRRRRRSVAVANAPRRKSYRRSHSRRRRNPPSFTRSGFLGLPISLKDIAIGGGAIVAQPLIENAILPMLPASISGTSYGRWAVRLGSAVAVGYGAKALVGREAAKSALIALGAVMLNDAVAEFTAPAAPGVITAANAAAAAEYQMTGGQSGRLNGFLPVRRGMQGFVPVRRGLNGGLIIDGSADASSNARTLALSQVPNLMSSGAFPSPF